MDFKAFLKRLSLSFASGMAGAFVARLVLYGFERWGVLSKFNVDLNASLDTVSLYPFLIWGGIFGLIFFFPIFGARNIFERSLLLALVPMLIMFLYVYPSVEHTGYFGFGYGVFTPLFVFILSFVWSLTTALWLRTCDK